jgi:hypothetical protein
MSRQDTSDPQVFRLLAGDGFDVRSGRHGSTATVYRDKNIEAVCVTKDREEIDLDWFTQRQVDLIVQLQGQLKVEFERDELADSILEPGDLIVLPRNTRCRAYRWPRDAVHASVFFAVYPINDEQQAS